LPLRKIARSVHSSAVRADRGEMTWSKSSLSTSWSALVDMGMAIRKRTRRMADLVPKREDGAEAYTLPDGKKIIDRYFALPGAFWTEKWFDELSLPAICVLLVLLKETNDDTEEVHLTHKQFEDWYGISVSSAKKGLAELEAHGLLSVRRHRVKAEFALEGFTLHLYEGTARIEPNRALIAGSAPSRCHELAGSLASS
jgi:hypothetical protein